MMAGAAVTSDNYFSLYKKHFLCSCIMLSMLCSHSVLAQTVIHYPRSESRADARQDYPVALLKLILQSSGNFLLEPTQMHMQQNRSLRMLKLGIGVDVVWTMTSKEREEELLPIRIPIDRGFLGWRLLLIRQGNEAAFKDIKTAKELSVLRVGQGHDWPDYELLKDNNFNAIPVATYEGLFEMLVRGHIDYFPRAITEIFQEMAARPQLNLMVEPKLLIHYPSAFYYFVKKDNQVLAREIETGLKTAIANGSMLELFNQYYGEAIEKAKLSDRTIIELTNPLLSKETPLGNANYWFSP